MHQCDVFFKLPASCSRIDMTSAVSRTVVLEDLDLVLKTLPVRYQPERKDFLMVEVAKMAKSFDKSAFDFRLSEKVGK